MATIEAIEILILMLVNSLLIEGSSKTLFVTCGSVIKLQNVDYGHLRLHSHDVKYGSGSGQQSVTGKLENNDVNSHWVVRGRTGELCDRGKLIKCGDIIRLRHLVTKKNLHSHFFNSPLSGNQEVSAYGDQDGEGDTGDDWEVICFGQEWHRAKKVQFRHVETRKFLGVSGRSYGHPISGHLEVVGLNSECTGSEWQSAEGVFFQATELVTKNIRTEY